MLNIHLPREIEEYGPELQQFFNIMILKLKLNRHKGFVEDQTVEGLIGRVIDETEELTKSAVGGTQEELLMECADVANLAFLTQLCALRMNKTHFQRRLHED